MDHGPYTRRVFARFPPYEYLIGLEQAVVEEVQLFCPTMNRASFFELVNEQYAIGPEKTDDNPARWAIINALLAAAMRYRMANDSVTFMAPLYWGYFKNAFAIFAELVVRGKSLLDCEALLAMATFSLGTADAQTTSQLASAAARAAQILGLHRRETYVGLGAMQSERHRRVCWVTHIINTDVMVKYGLPSSFRQEEITTDFPAEAVADLGGSSRRPATTTLSFLRRMAQISRIQAKIHENCSPEALKLQSGAKHLATVLSLSFELDEWTSQLPEDARPTLTALAANRELDTPAALLHLIYFNAIIKTHTNYARLKNAPKIPPSHPLYTDWISRDSVVQIHHSHARCISAARAIIDTLRVMPPQPYVHFWTVLCYPVMACLILLWSSLEEPKAPEAQSNVKMMGQFVQYLAGLQEEGCDVKNVLDGCSRFHKVAKYTVHTRRVIRVLNPTEECNNVTEQLETLRLKLSGVTDWMQLAQGLLGNIPSLCAQAQDMLSDVLNMEQTDGEYGLFAPDVVKPHKNNFTFGT
ncbi:Transcriptional activator protein acu-15-like protein 1 [Colletotrichum chlorophyti]|uniref:Transcriptional activator protein acu-15-like protein 1 n=1 Tax=Colletotrichum chlorophyti TaxID=708187 RepID=A0A1Q8RUC5_9PEZI|nr:Transcriptional activator protein acu-15-like protein 1 [Colletotrichum chlorophyti]